MSGDVQIQVIVPPSTELDKPDCSTATVFASTIFGLSSDLTLLMTALKQHQELDILVPVAPPKHFHLASLVAADQNLLHCQPVCLVVALLHLVVYLVKSKNIPVLLNVAGVA